MRRGRLILRGDGRAVGVEEGGSLSASLCPRSFGKKSTAGEESIPHGLKPTLLRAYETQG